MSNPKKKIKESTPSPVTAKAFDPTPYLNPKYNVSKQEIIEIKKAFDIFDTDGSGSIDPKELAEAFSEMGMNTNNKLIYQILAELDKDGSGVIDFEEFMKMAIVRTEFKPSKKELMKIFKIFDVSKKGRISQADLKKIADELGQEMTDEELRKMIKKADKDDDGLVNFEDFCLITFGKTFEDNE